MPVQAVMISQKIAGGGGGGPTLSLFGSGSSSTGAPSSVNISAPGYDDWAVVGAGLAGGYSQRKNGGGSTIGTLTTAGVPGGSTIDTYGGGPRTISWTGDASPGPDGSTDETAYCTTGGLNSSLSITYPATNSRRRATFYCGWYQGDVVRATASLSDASASSVSGTLNGINDAGLDDYGFWTFEYEAGSPGQTLTIRLSFDSIHDAGAVMEAQAGGWINA